MHFQIVPTTLCNARCFYCYENDCMFETMQTSVVEATIDFIKKYIVDNPDDNYSIDWFGGEPMLVPELILYMANEILQYCKDRLVNINSEIVTNASKINAESIYFFESIGISRVHISIDGMREEYEKRKAFVDGKKYFDQIISAIQLLTNHDIQVMLRVNVDKNNIDSCYQLKLVFLVKADAVGQVRIEIRVAVRALGNLLAVQVHLRQMVHALKFQHQRLVAQALIRRKAADVLVVAPLVPAAVDAVCGQLRAGLRLHGVVREGDGDEVFLAVQMAKEPAGVPSGCFHRENHPS